MYSMYLENVGQKTLQTLEYLAIALYWTQTTLSHNTEWQDQLAAANIL